LFNCYGPSQIRNAYALSSLIASGNDGSGRTITIVDAFQNPTMASDLASFDKTFGLPAPPSFKTIAPLGKTSFNASDPNQVGWSSEIAIDVEWAHAIAPGAKIVLALAPSDSDADLIATESYVISKGLGDVVSMSFGDAEQCMDPALQQKEHSLYASANAAGVTLLAASGDVGAAQYSCDGSSFVKAVSIPASDPDVTAVGGTELFADLTSGAYKNETTWNEPKFNAAGGGGFSSVYPRPDFQNGVSGVGTMRGVPDVAFDASIQFGVIVAWGSSGSSGEYWIFGGTSVGSPNWAGIVALADQAAGHDLGNINGKLYALGNSGAPDFNDILNGNNSFQSISGYTAKHGWDAATGWGSPVGANLVKDLS
jgi:subtilase family serine protease